MKKELEEQDKLIAAKGYRNAGNGSYIKWREPSDEDKARGINFQSDSYNDRQAVLDDINSRSFRKGEKDKWKSRLAKPD